MKKIIVSNPEKCSGCKECEKVCSETFYKAYKQSYSCVRVNENKISVCDQCGLCEKVCPVGAITQNKSGVFLIDKNVCIGCLACMDICPNNVICKSFDNAYATKCIVCKACVKACVNNVLEVCE